MQSDYFTVDVIIEIERDSNQKWEYDRLNDRLFLDRVLNKPYVYPYPYGFFPNTLGNDGDELDILLITDNYYPNYNIRKTTITGYIVGGLMMHDEKGEDEKIFVVPSNEIQSYLSKTKFELQFIYNTIEQFFSNYKSTDENKWSSVERILSREEAVEVYRKSVYAFKP
jgi:inorganic pyrophosphatase